MAVRVRHLDRPQHRLTGAGSAAVGPVEVHFTNLQQFAKLAKATGAASKDLKKELRQGLNRAVKPLGARAKEGISRYVPSGYAPILRRSFRTSTRISLTGNPRVTLRGKAKGRHKDRRVDAIDKGILRHPTFANREAWVAQKIRSGFWSDPMREGGPAVRGEAVAVITEMNRKIVERVAGG